MVPLYHLYTTCTTFLPPLYHLYTTFLVHILPLYHLYTTYTSFIPPLHHKFSLSTTFIPSILRLYNLYDLYTTIMCITYVASQYNQILNKCDIDVYKLSSCESCPNMLFAIIELYWRQLLYDKHTVFTNVYVQA